MIYDNSLTEDFPKYDISVSDAWDHTLLGRWKYNSKYSLIKLIQYYNRNFPTDSVMYVFTNEKSVYDTLRLFMRVRIAREYMVKDGYRYKIGFALPVRGKYGKIKRVVGTLKKSL